MRYVVCKANHASCKPRSLLLWQQTQPHHVILPHPKAAAVESEHYPAGVTLIITVRRTKTHKGVSCFQRRWSLVLGAAGDFNVVHGGAVCRTRLLDFDPERAHSCVDRAANLRGASQSSTHGNSSSSIQQQVKTGAIKVKGIPGGIIDAMHTLLL
jgi:hypothetical protein